MGAAILQPAMPLALVLVLVGLGIAGAHGETSWERLGHWASPPAHAAGQPLDHDCVGHVETKLPDSPVLGNGDMATSIGVSSDGARLVMHLGSNQLWAVGGWNERSLGYIHADAPLPRRVGFGSLSLSVPGLASSTSSAVQFQAHQNIDDATISVGFAIGQKVNVSAVVRLGADENTLLADITVAWDPSVVAPLVVNATALPLSTVCRRGDSQQPAPLCVEFDGHAHSGCTNGSAWISRSPLSADKSRRPITAAVAATVSNAAAKCSARGLEIAKPTNGRAQFTLVAAFVTNRDLCASPAGCSAPLPAAIARSTALAGSVSEQTAVREAHAQHWARFWELSSISLPQEPLLEEFWRGQQFLMGASSPHQPEAFDSQLVPAAGLYGPFVFSDNPGWAGTYLLCIIII